MAGPDTRLTVAARVSRVGPAPRVEPFWVRAVRTVMPLVQEGLVARLEDWRRSQGLVRAHVVPQMWQSDHDING